MANSQENDTTILPGLKDVTWGAVIERKGTIIDGRVKPGE
jgi:hypothetical protein